MPGKEISPATNRETIEGMPPFNSQKITYFVSQIVKCNSKKRFQKKSLTAGHFDGKICAMSSGLYE